MLVGDCQIPRLHSASSDSEIKIHKWHTVIFPVSSGLNSELSSNNHCKKYFFSNCIWFSFIFVSHTDNIFLAYIRLISRHGYEQYRYRRTVLCWMFLVLMVFVVSDMNRRWTQTDAHGLCSRSECGSISVHPRFAGITAVWNLMQPQNPSESGMFLWKSDFLIIRGFTTRRSDFEE